MNCVNTCVPHAETWVEILPNIVSLNRVTIDGVRIGNRNHWKFSRPQLLQLSTGCLPVDFLCSPLGCRLQATELVMAAGPRYLFSARTAQKTPLSTAVVLLRACRGYHVTATEPLPTTVVLTEQFLATGASAGFTILAFSRYAHIRTKIWPRNQEIRLR
jgi:hypothetical protein